MNPIYRMTLILTAALLGTPATAAEMPRVPMAPEELISSKAVMPKVVDHKSPTPAVVKSPAPESSSSIAANPTTGLSSKGVFSTQAVPATGTALAPPVTISYSGSAVALEVDDGGSANKGLYVNLSNASNSASALFGQTYGSGSGLSGYSKGVGGPAGKFYVQNAANPQPGMFATTAGTGSAIVGTVTSINNNSPALQGVNKVSADFGIGVEGDGNYIGVYGTGTAAGVYGYSASSYGSEGASQSGYGIFGSSSSGDGIGGISDTGYGVYASSNSSSAIYAISTTGTAMQVSAGGDGGGITVHSVGGIGIYGISDLYYGIWGQSENAIGVVGKDTGTGIGVYGTSASGYAGYFFGMVGATSYITLSDRNAKTHIRPIDAQDVLARLSRLPITEWDFKTDLNKHHMGPMAQDFHSAFGLDGSDDTHINLTDIAGVSLVAIQALNHSLNQDITKKDAEIAELKQRLDRQDTAIAQVTEKFAARMSALEAQRSVEPAQTASLRTP